MGNALLYVATVETVFGAQGDLIPQFELKNPAERGGVMGTTIEVALASPIRPLTRAYSVRPLGLEPRTCGLRVRCSAN